MFRKGKFLRTLRDSGKIKLVKILVTSQPSPGKITRIMFMVLSRLTSQGVDIISSKVNIEKYKYLISNNYIFLQAYDGQR